MKVTEDEKIEIEQKLAGTISGPEVKKVILFGSFLESNNPSEINLAVISEENLDYVSKVKKYREKVKDISKKLPVEIFPLSNSKSSYLYDKIKNGITIYSR